MSKSGAAINRNTPVTISIVNFAASGPPTTLYTIVCTGRSASVAVTVVTAVVFSEMLILAAAPPPLLVMIGVLSLTGEIAKFTKTLLSAPIPSSTENARLSLLVSVPS